MSDSNVSSFRSRATLCRSKRRMLRLDSAFPKTLPNDYGYFDDCPATNHYPHYRGSVCLAAVCRPARRGRCLSASDPARGWNPAAHLATISRGGARSVVPRQGQDEARTLAWLIGSALAGCDGTTTGGTRTFRNVAKARAGSGTNPTPVGTYGDSAACLLTVSAARKEAVFRTLEPVKETTTVQAIRSGYGNSSNCVPWGSLSQPSSDQAARLRCYTRFLLRLCLNVSGLPSGLPFLRTTTSWILPLVRS